MTKFQPNRITLEEGLKRISDANKKIDFDPNKKITTSKDKIAEELKEELKINNIPDGFDKWQLPFSLSCSGAQLFMSVGKPGIDVPLHSHDEGQGIRFIISGSIIYDGKELTSGDWMHIPKGAEYSFKVGKSGVSMCY